jgi:hypothetical protein
MLFNIGMYASPLSIMVSIYITFSNFLFKKLWLIYFFNVLIM